MLEVGSLPFPQGRGQARMKVLRADPRREGVPEGTEPQQAVLPPSLLDHRCYGPFPGETAGREAKHKFLLRSKGEGQVGELGKETL